MFRIPFKDLRERIEVFRRLYRAPREMSEALEQGKGMVGLRILPPDAVSIGHERQRGQAILLRRKKRKHYIR